MKISYLWLQEYFDELLPDPAGLSDILSNYAFEVDSLEKKEQDTIMDIKVLPDRAHDCFSHYGIAREIGAILNIQLKSLELLYSLDTSDNFKTSSFVKLFIEDKNCRRVMKCLAQNIDMSKPTPEHIRSRLEALGQRSINIVVDIANFVMFETGQPVHTFDYSKISKFSDSNAGLTDDSSTDSIATITIRNAQEGESLTALDNKKYELTTNMLVIADNSGPLDIAGIKGGSLTAIDSETKNVLLSVCSFEPINIRHTRTKLGLRTDASDRFEKDLSPELVPMAMQRLATLLQKYAGAKISEEIIDVYPNPRSETAISFSISDISNILGLEIEDAVVSNILERLSYVYTRDALGILTVIPPAYRLDVRIKEDVIKDIGRLYGYQNIPANIFTKTSTLVNFNPRFYYISRLRHFLVESGFSEIYTRTFQDQGEVALANPTASDKSFLHASLIADLNESLTLNCAIAPLLGLSQIRIFEIDGVFRSPEKEILMLGLGIRNTNNNKKFKDSEKEKEEIEEIIQAAEKELGIRLVLSGSDESVREYKIESIDEIADGKIYSELNLRPESTSPRYRPFSVFPFVLRDIALWVPEQVSVEEVAHTIREHAGTLLVRAPELFDTFKKEGRVSFGLRLVFQSFEKTLSDAEVNIIMDSITQSLNEKAGFEVR